MGDIHQKNDRTINGWDIAFFDLWKIKLKRRKQVIEVSKISFWNLQKDILYAGVIHKNPGPPVMEMFCFIYMDIEYL